jgi:hypothetical protein
MLHPFAGIADGQRDSGNSDTGSSRVDHLLCREGVKSRLCDRRGSSFPIRGGAVIVERRLPFALRYAEVMATDGKLVIAGGARRTGPPAAKSLDLSEGDTGFGFEAIIDA